MEFVNDITISKLDMREKVRQSSFEKLDGRVLFKLAAACLLASILGAGLVIGADRIFDIAAPGNIPKPQRAQKLRAHTSANFLSSQRLTMSAAELQALYLVRSTLLALDQANRTGIYSVLRALGTPQFSARNSPADLAMIFSNLRRHKIDLAEVAIETPAWQEPILIKNAGLRLRGIIPVNSHEIYFDMQFKSVAGIWRIYALTVLPQKLKKARQGIVSQRTDLPNIKAGDAQDAKVRKAI